MTPTGRRPRRSRPYADSDEHLLDELRRIDLLVRGQTLRWRATIAEGKPQRLWGMAYVSHTEVDAYLMSPFHVGHLPPPGPPLSDQSPAPEDFHREAADQARAIQARLAATPARSRLRLVQLADRFRLGDLERDLVLTCLLPELDTRYRRLLGYLDDDASRALPSVGLLLEILHPLAGKLGPARAALDPAGPLRRNHLIVVTSGPGTPLAARQAGLDDRVVEFLLGSDRPDGRLAKLVTEPAAPTGWPELVLDDERMASLESLAEWLPRRQRPDAGVVLFLHGPYGSGRRLAARAVCGAADTPLLVLDVGTALQAAVPWELLVDLTFREARLRGAALYWSGLEALVETDDRAAQLDHLVTVAERHPGLTFLGSQIAWDPVGRFREGGFLRLSLPLPGYERRRQLWERFLPPDDAFAAPPPDRPALAAALANGFQFTGGQIADAVTTAHGLAAQRDAVRPRLRHGDLYEGCRRQSGRRLIAFAQRVERRDTASFEDLVLPVAIRRQLDELRARIRNQGRVYVGLGFEQRLRLGRGLIVLFTGSSGTGKTMAAELLAQEQGVDLYKVDLSAVVSKWVGETEKNLARVFAEAEAVNAMLFFDEADSLFGKRGEVKDPRDRWANAEVDFLLQRVEEYAGVVVLASNLLQNIDEAFMRRIQTVIEFPRPGPRARQRIWAGMFPPQVGRPDDEELKLLAARFQLAGGSIKNVVLDAAFRALARDQDQPVTATTRDLVVSTAREYQKLGLPITKGDFGEDWYGWVEELLSDGHEVAQPLPEGA